MEKIYWPMTLQQFCNVTKLLTRCGASDKHGSCQRQLILQDYTVINWFEVYIISSIHRAKWGIDEDDINR